MNFYTKKHKHYCGIDLHAKTMYLCIVNNEGTILLHKNMKTRPTLLEKAITPFLEDLAICVECLFTWYWIADFCRDHHIKFVLGHALYMKAIHGGKAKNDKIDSKKIALLFRGGNIPQGYVYPRERRSTRDLLRRRMHLMRKRAELYAHVQNTNSQYNLPEVPLNLRHKANRIPLRSHFPDPSVQRAVDLNLDLIGIYDEHLGKVEYYIEKHAKAHDYQMWMLLRSVPGIGALLSLVFLYEIDTIERFPTVQDFASYCRLIKCQSQSAGKTYGTSGAKIGNAHLKWAFSEAAVLFIRSSPEAKKYVEQLTQKHGKGKALSIFAHKIGRAVYFIWKRKKPFDKEQFFGLNTKGGEAAA